MMIMTILAVGIISLMLGYGLGREHTRKLFSIVQNDTNDITTDALIMTIDESGLGESEKVFFKTRYLMNLQLKSFEKIKEMTK